MLTRVLPALAIWTVVVACCFVFRETAARAAQDVAPPAGAEPAPSPRPSAMQPAPSVAHQMQSLERYTRFDMILYSGSFGGASDLAATRAELQAIALDVKSR